MRRYDDKTGQSAFRRKNMTIRPAHDNLSHIAAYRVSLLRNGRLITAAPLEIYKKYDYKINFGGYNGYR